MQPQGVHFELELSLNHTLFPIFHCLGYEHGGFPEENTIAISVLKHLSSNNSSLFPPCLLWVQLIHLIKSSGFISHENVNTEYISGSSSSSSSTLLNFLLQQDFDFSKFSLSDTFIVAVKLVTLIGRYLRFSPLSPGLFGSVGSKKRVLFAFLIPK